MPEEYVIPLYIDVQQVLAKSQSVKETLTAVSNEAKKVGSDTKAGFDSAAKGASDLSAKIVDNSQKIGLLNKNVLQLEIQMQSYQTVAKQALDPKIIADYNAKAEALKNQITQLSNAGKKGFDEFGVALEKVNVTTQKSTNYFSQAFSKLRTIAYILPGIGIAGLLAFFTGPIIEYLAKLDLFTGKTQLLIQQLRDQASVQNALNDAVLSGAKKSNDEVTNIDALYHATQNLKLSIQERTKAAIELQDLYPTIFGNLTTEAILAGKGADAYKSLKEEVIALAYAEAVKNKVSQLATRELDDELKIADLQKEQTRLIKIKTQAALDYKNAVTGSDETNAYAKNIQANTDLKAVLKQVGDIQKDQNLILIERTQLEQRLDAIEAKRGTKVLTGGKNPIDEQTKLQLENQKEQVKIDLDTQNDLAANDKLSYDKRRAALAKALDDEIQIININEKEKQLNTNVSEQAKQNILDKAAEERVKATTENNKKVQTLNNEEQRKAEEQQKKFLSTKKELNDKLIQLQNDYNTSQINALDDAQTKEIAKNDIDYQNRVRTLQQQQKDLISQKNQYDKDVKAGLSKGGLDPDFEKDIRQFSLNIAKVTEEGQQADLTIIAKYAALKLKAQQDSLRAIGVLLKDETQARIDAINANYDKVIEVAKKNGSLTTDYEKQLAQQRQEDISDVESKAVLDRLNRTNELEIAAIKSQAKKKGETQEQYERDIQTQLLNQDIASQKQIISALSAQFAETGFLTPDQQKAFADAIQKIYKDQQTLADLKPVKIANPFELFGFSKEDAAALNEAYTETFSSLSSIFGSLSSIADQNVQAIQKQIDAINTLIQTDTDAVATQQSLADKGRANSLDAAKKKLADDQAQKVALQKQAEEAQKKTQALQKAQILADTALQASSLATAIANTLASLSKIPVIGPALAIAAVGTMIAAFVIGKVEAIRAVNASSTQTAEEGGIAGGDRHSNGGNKYVSIDGKDRNILEIERGERIFSRKNSEKHKRLFEAIQNNDFSKLDIGDVSIQDLLRGTGVMQQLEVARMTGSQNITLQDRANNVVVIANNSDKYLSSIDKKMDNLNKKDPVILDMGDYVWIDYGNGKTERRYK